MATGVYVGTGSQVVFAGLGFVARHIPTTAVRRSGTKCSGRDAGRRQDLVEGADGAGQERAELRVARRRLVVAHRVHARLEIVGVDGEQRDPPFVVVDARGPRDQLQYPPRELAAGAAVAV